MRWPVAAVGECEVRRDRDPSLSRARAAVAFYAAFIALIGVGLAEAAGLIGALIRKLVAVSPGGTLTFIIVLLGVISSIASDAGYLVLIPLGAVAFASELSALRELRSPRQHNRIPWRSAATGKRCSNGGGK